MYDIDENKHLLTESNYTKAYHHNVLQQTLEEGMKLNFSHGGD